MELKTETLKRCELVTLSGWIDSESAPGLEEKLLSLIESGKKNLVLNMREVDYVSSAGLKALIAAQIKVSKMRPKGSVVVSEISPELKSTFELVGFHRLFDFYDSDVEAVGSF